MFIVEAILGGSGTTRVIVVEFPSEQDIRNIFTDPEYQKVVQVRDVAHPVLDVMIAENLTLWLKFSPDFYLTLKARSVTLYVSTVSRKYP